MKDSEAPCGSIIQVFPETCQVGSLASFADFLLLVVSMAVVGFEPGRGQVSML